MLLLIFFAVLTVGSSAFAWIMGGRDGRIVALLMIVATLATSIVERASTWSHTQIPIMIVDAAMFLSLYALALRSDRFWPLWIAAFQLAAVSAHIATVPMGSVTGRVYQAIAVIWVVPLQLVLIGGIWMDRLSAVEKGFDDHDPK